MLPILILVKPDTPSTLPPPTLSQLSCSVVFGDAGWGGSWNKSGWPQMAGEFKALGWGFLFEPHELVITALLHRVALILASVHNELPEVVF